MHQCPAPITTTTSSTSAAITKCPAEIWGKIFSLVCVDGGQMGRSLSLVSKYIQEASKPYKYQTLLVSEDNLRSLIFTLKRTPDDNRRVLHLFLSSRGWGKGELFDSASPFGADKIQLLSLIAPSLQSLCLGHRAPFDITLPFPLPALVDLVILGRSLFHQQSHADMAFCYPILRRFYLGSCYISQLTACIKALPPSVKILRIVSAAAEPSPASRAVACLASALGVSQCNSSPMMPSPTLERLFYQAAHLWPDDTLNDLRRLAEKDVRFVLLKGPCFLGTLTAEQKWLETCAGQRDYWELADKDIDSERPRPAGD